MDKESRGRILGYHDELMSLPVEERREYGYKNCLEFVEKYPKLFHSICDEKNPFDTAYLRHMLNVLDDNADVDVANEKIVNELQQKYLLPVLKKLNKLKKESS